MIAHWDEVEGRLLESGPMRLTRIDLGDAIGSDRVGVALLKVQPGGRSSPVGPPPSMSQPARTRGSARQQRGSSSFPPLGQGRRTSSLDEAPTILDGAVRILGATGGSVRTGLNTFTQEPGDPYVPHCHSAEEEIFVVLEGSGMFHVGEATFDVHAGHAISRPPGTDIPHRFTAGPDGMTHLAYGTREPNDIVYFPEAGEVVIRGVGVTLQVP